MAEAHDTRGARRRALAAAAKTIDDLPNDVLVSVFIAVEDPWWVRHTIPLVCRAWNELYLSKDASPLHETLELDFFDEVDRAKRERLRLVARPLTGAAAQELAPRRPVVHASRVIFWAQRRAGSVRKLRVDMERVSGAYLDDFSSGDLGALLLVVRSSLTEIRARFGFKELYAKQFWKSLRDFVVPAGRLRSLRVKGIKPALLESDVEPLGQLAGSLEELVLTCVSGGLRRFPESFCALQKLWRLKLRGHSGITAIPAGISSLKKLEKLDLRGCRLSSLPKEVGDLSGLTKLALSRNTSFGRTPQEEAFPAELRKLKSLRGLHINRCSLRTVPAFIGGLESLEVLDITENFNLQVGAPLDFLVAGCPRLRVVKLGKLGSGPRFTRESRAHIEAFKAKLRAKNPNARVSY